MEFRKLNDRQIKFCENYLKNGNNGTQTAIDAGYSKNSAGAIASENLKKPYIDNYLNNRRADIEKKMIASTDSVLKFWTRVMKGEVLDAFGMEASLDTRLYASDKLGKALGLDKKVIEGTIREIPLVVIEQAIEETYADEMKKETTLIGTVYES